MSLVAVDAIYSENWRILSTFGEFVKPAGCKRRWRNSGSKSKRN